MYFIILEASPRPSHPELAEFGGAFAACWVATDDPIVADREARAVLADAGWDTVAVDEHYPVDRARYVGNAELLARVDQALADGVAITINTWATSRRKRRAQETRRAS